MTDMPRRNAMAITPMSRAAKHRTWVREAWTGLPAYRTQPVVLLAISTAIASNSQRVGHEQARARWKDRRATVVQRSTGPPMQSKPDITVVMAPLRHAWVRVSGAGATPSVVPATSRKGSGRRPRAGETRIELEFGARVPGASGPLSIEGQVPALVTHEASRYEERGASGAIRVAPGALGLGLTLSLVPVSDAPVSGYIAPNALDDAQQSDEVRRPCQAPSPASRSPNGQLAPVVPSATRGRLSGSLVDLGFGGPTSIRNPTSNLLPVG